MNAPVLVKSMVKSMIKTIVKAKKSVLPFILFCTMVLLSSCATHTINTHRVMLADNISYVLQPIPESLINTGIQALFKVKQNGEEKQFLMQVEMTSGHLLISGMTIEGLSLFNLDWNSDLGTIDYDKKIAIDPLRILAESQLVLWPAADVTKGLEHAELILKIDNNREISVEKDIFYQVNYQANDEINNKNNVSTLINLKHNYAIEIEELERWPLENDNAQGSHIEQENTSSLSEGLTENN